MPIQLILAITPPNTPHSIIMLVITRTPATDAQKIFYYTDLQRTKPTRHDHSYEYYPGRGNRHQPKVYSRRSVRRAE
jgi:hypothetical protein